MTQRKPGRRVFVTTQLAAGDLLPAEWVRARAQLGRSVYLPAVFIAVLWGVVFVWAMTIGLALVALLAASVVGGIVPVLALWAFWRRCTCVLLLTDQRVVAVHGPFPRRVCAIPLASLDQVHVRQARGLLGMRVGRGNSVFATAFSDSGLPTLEMHDLADADAFSAAVMSAVSGRRSWPAA